MASAKKRLRELDFLRGVAIILVLLRHQLLFEFTANLGWIGVDLFFVLSGFLVSGLLFREHEKYGNVRPGLFLIRRGFKIYPLYYLFYLPYLAILIFKNKLDPALFFSDMFFVQNYVNGWGYAYAPSWSLAIEEHFYFGFALLMYFGIAKGFFGFRKLEKNVRLTRFEYFIFSVLAICLAMRLLSNALMDSFNPRLITMTHLRIDSLLAGVLVSYWYYFRREMLASVIGRNKTAWLIFALALLSFTPFIVLNESFFVKTIGFTFLYTGFAIILALFLIDDKINLRLDRLFTSQLVDLVSRIGFASYSIYIIHTLVNYSFALAFGMISGGSANRFVAFTVTSSASVFCGIWMTAHIEKYFLSLRDKHYPARIS